MYRSVGKCWLLLGIVVVFVMAAACPAQAGWWTKYYRFVNQTGSDQHYARAILQGLEVVTDFYSGPWEPWRKGKAGCMRLGGVWSTTVTSPQATAGGLIPNGKAVMMGWHAADGNCRLRDLRWLNADGVASPPILPTNAWGVPGGGELIENPDGTYTWIIHNDTDSDMQLANVQFGPFSGYFLDWINLDQAADEGVAGKRVIDIDLLILDLRLRVIEAQEKEQLPDPSANGLLRKTDKAVDDKHAGLASFEAGDPDRALFYWSRAIRHMETFISEIQSTSGRKKMPEGLAQEWIADAEDIIAELQDLAQFKALSATGAVPNVLPDGQSASFLISGVGPGDALVLSGWVLGPDNEPVLQWTEQVRITDPDDAVPPVLDVTITPGPDAEPYYNGWHNAKLGDDDVVVTLDASDVGSGVAGIYVGEDGLVFDFIPVDQLPYELTFSDDGVYKIVCFAGDNAGNISDQQTYLVKIDTTIPSIQSATISPTFLWPPEHEMITMTITAAMTDENPAGELPTWFVESVASNQDELGGGQGDYYPDWLIGANGESLQLRAERCGTLEIRVYTVTIRARDVAGNESVNAVTFDVPVTHDQGS